MSGSTSPRVTMPGEALRTTSDTPLIRANLRRVRQGLLEVRHPAGGRGNGQAVSPPEEPDAATSRQPDVRVHGHAGNTPVGRLHPQILGPESAIRLAHRLP